MTATLEPTADYLTCTLEDLTDRERDVMTMVTNGRSNKEIAEELYLSINSVKTYIRGAYRRAGVTSRPQAVIWGVRNGLLADPVPAA